MSDKEHSHKSTNNNDEVNVLELLQVLWINKFRILAFTVMGALLGVVYALSVTPIYRAEALLEVSSQSNPLLSGISDVLGSNQQSPTESEIEIIRSRMVLGKSVESLQLENFVEPHYATPVVGKLLNFGKEEPILHVAQFTVPEHWLGKPFRIVARSETEYDLILPDEKMLVGTVGQVLKIDGEYVLLLNERLPSGQAFTLTRQSFLQTIQHVQKNLAVAPKGKNSPIVGLSYTSHDRKLAKEVLNSIMFHYMEQNRAKDVQFANSGLTFINDELPGLHMRLREAEDRLNQYRAQSGSVDVPTEAKTILESLTKIETQLTNLRAEQVAMSEVYTTEHPSLKAVLEKIAVLQNAKAQLNQQIAVMPQIQQEIVRLTRDVEINQTTYMQLLNKKQELGILRATSQGKVRIIDSAMTEEKPIKPNKKLLVALSVVTAFLLASTWYLLKSLLHRGLHSEDEIHALGTEVFASIPESDTLSRLDKLFMRTRSNQHIRSNTLLAIKDPTDVAVEAIRALRTNLFFNVMGRDNKLVMISGTGEAVGKSFISANLAVVIAQSDKRVLLIDGDLRKGYMYALMQKNANHVGLAEILVSTQARLDFTRYIQSTHVPLLDFLSCGKASMKPAELLLSDNLTALFDWAEEHYDYIIVDTPPILAVTDAAVIGQHAGLTLLVSRFRQTSGKELQMSLERLKRSNIDVSGVVLNGIRRDEKNHYYYSAYTKYGKNGK